MYSTCILIARNTKFINVNVFSVENMGSSIILVHPCVCLKFSTYQFVSVTIASMIEAAKYNLKASDAFLTDFMEPLFLANRLLVGQSLVVTEHPVYCMFLDYVM